MQIDELDEFQGLTADMVREWLTQQKATFGDGHWTHPSGLYRYKDGAYGGLLWSMTLFQMSADFDKHNLQALLREINPRMRKGWPSGNALANHDRWIARKPYGDLIVCRWRPPYMVNAAGGGDFALREQCEHWEFWPCDEHGNKVRWPVDAEGKML